MSGFFSKIFGGGADAMEKAKRAYDLRLPFEIIVGVEAPARLDAALAARNGRSSPLLLNDDDLDGVHVAAAQARRQPPSAIIEASLSFDVAGFFARQRQAYEEPGGLLNGAEVPGVIIGEWQGEGYPADGLKAHLGGGWSGMKPAAHVALIAVPTPNSFEIPAYLNYGGFDDCPPPHVVVAIARDWRRRYGAELVAISTHVLQFKVERQPADREEATALAMEHFLFCSTIVEPSDWTLNHLAEGLLTETHWLFVFDRHKPLDAA